MRCQTSILGLSQDGLSDSSKSDGRASGLSELSRTSNFGMGVFDLFLPLVIAVNLLKFEEISF